MSNPNWEDDLAQSTRQFRDIVWPEIRHWFGDDPEIHPVEGRDDGLFQAFDQLAGVDFWLVNQGLGMASIASRVQSDYDYETFTIRHSRESGADTEHQKRMKQLTTDHQLPTWTVQAYVEPVLQVVQNAAACRSESLYQYISQKGEPGDEWPLIQSNESETFYPVPWSELDGELDLRIQNRSRAGLDVDPENPENIREWATPGVSTGPQGGAQ